MKEGNLPPPADIAPIGTRLPPERDREQVAHSPQLLQVVARMQSRPLVIITTRLPPQICGVGTFSWLLQRYWSGDPSPHHFLVVDDGGRSARESESRPVSQFGQDWSVLVRTLVQFGSADVLLHYAGRGYHRFGFPFGLATALRKWKVQFPAGRLVVFFHELPGRLPLTSRHYWLNVLNRRIVRKLANLADLIMTNTPEHARTLERISRHRRVACLVVPSGIEKIEVGDETRARTEFVIFGLAYGRWQTLQMFDGQIREWQEKGILTKLHLIGPPDNKFDLRSEALLRSYPKPDVVIRHGQLPAEEVSRLLSRVQFALTLVNEATWSKSSSYTACLAHGCVVIGNSKSTTEPLSWSVRPHEVASLSEADLKARSRESVRWYEANADWKVLARTVSDLITNLPGRDI